MSTSGSDYHFQFEIAIVLVIGLLIYVFVSLAMVAGYHLWNIQTKVNTFQLHQKSHDSQPSNGRQNASASESYSTDCSSDDRNRRLYKELCESQQDARGKQFGLENEQAKSSRYHNAAISARNALSELVTNTPTTVTLEATPEATAAAYQRLLKGMTESVGKIRENLERASDIK